MVGDTLDLVSVLVDMLAGIAELGLTPSTDRAQTRQVRSPSTRSLIIAWIVGGSAFGLGCYLVEAANTMLWVGVGVASLVCGLPMALAVTFLWRTPRAKQ